MVCKCDLLSFNCVRSLINQLDFTQVHNVLHLSSQCFFRKSEPMAGWYKLHHEDPPPQT